MDRNGRNTDKKEDGGMEKRKNERRKRRRSWRAGIAATIGAVFAMGAILVSASTAGAAGLLIADGGFGGRLEIIEHDVNVVVNNGVAVTEVTQVFRNMEDRQVEALYTFPVPKGASVANFSMWINGKEMVGEVLEKKRAREIYNSYKRRRRDPGLLEQKDFKTFEMRIFPIAARAEQRVQISYYQELDFDHDWATYVYPLATTTAQQVDSRIQGRFAASLEVRSPVRIVDMQSPSHGDDFLVVRHTDNYYEASLERQDGDLGRDMVLAFHASRPATGLDLITSREKGEDGFFSLTLTAGKELEKEEKGSDYVFILDVSGSMANERKLGTSRNSIEEFVKALGPHDRFELIVFNSQPGPLFRRLTEVNEDSLRQAVSFLKSQEARGGTRLQPALGAAYKYSDPDRFLNAVILSDGLTDQAERKVLTDSSRSRPANVRVFCIGVGNDINKPLLKQIAEDAGGLASFISQGDDFQRQAQAFRRKLTHPAASDVKIRISGVEVYDLEPETLPSLYFGMPVRLYGRYRGRGDADVRLSATVNGRETEQTATLVFPSTDDSNPEIERMWAWHRLQSLQEEQEMNGTQGTVDEIVRLGEAFSIASEYTSFIVLENDAEYKRWKIERRNALRIQRDREAQQRTRRALEELRKKAINELGPLNENQEKDAQHVAHAPVGQAPGAPARTSRPQPVDQSGGRSFDMPNLGRRSSGGGGAVGPLGALIALVLGGGSYLSGRKRR